MNSDSDQASNDEIADANRNPNTYDDSSTENEGYSEGDTVSSNAQTPPPNIIELENSAQEDEDARQQVQGNKDSIVSRETKKIEKKIEDGGTGVVSPQQRGGRRKQSKKRRRKGKRKTKKRR